MPFDINIQIVPAAEYNSMAFYSFGQTRSLGVRGIQKLVNMFAKFLLTPVGTDPLDASYGTSLPFMIGNNVSLSDAREILDLSVEATVTAIQGYQVGNARIPDSERLSSATVEAYLEIPEGPGFAAQILIRNVSNQELQLVLPTLEVR